MPRLIAALPAAALLLTGIAFALPPHAKPMQTLAQARRGFVTHLRVKHKTPDPVVPPPSGFQLVHYRAPLGSFPAYLAFPHRRQSHMAGRHPALLWITGGFDNSIGDTSWVPATSDNDQSARAFYQAGIMTMYPSLRGGNNNPGYIEAEYGEVNDVLAAADYLAHRPDVDPKRIYLGGHSTGGTLALLVAESSHRFRAVFAFGPIAFASWYGQDTLPFDIHNRQEDHLRSPAYYMSSIQTPTYVFEGEEQPGNIDSLRVMYRLNHNPHLHFYALPGLNHFSELAPTTPIVAKHIIKDNRTKREFAW